jgi:hypothetical protein
MEADKYWSAPVAQEPSSFQGRLLCIEKKPDMYWSASRMRKGQSFQQRKSPSPTAERTGLGPHLSPQNAGRLMAFALWSEKTGQVLVRTSG